MLTPSLSHVHFFHFSDTCNHVVFGSNGSINFLESLLSLIPFQRAGPALVLECYDTMIQHEFIYMSLAFGVVQYQKTLLYEETK
jgi:hypothetical protein